MQGKYLCRGSLYSLLLVALTILYYFEFPSGWADGNFCGKHNQDVPAGNLIGSFGFEPAKPAGSTSLVGLFRQGCNQRAPIAPAWAPCQVRQLVLLVHQQVLGIARGGIFNLSRPSGKVTKSWMCLSFDIGPPNVACFPSVSLSNHTNMGVPNKKDKFGVLGSLRVPFTARAWALSRKETDPELQSAFGVSGWPGATTGGLCGGVVHAGVPHHPLVPGAPAFGTCFFLFCFFNVRIPVKEIDRSWRCARGGGVFLDLNGAP